jgi:hypothetical protein
MCGHRGEFGFGCGIDLGAVEGLVVLEHAKDGVEELAHGGDQGLHFGFTARQQVLVVGAHMRLMPHGDEGGHVEGLAQVLVAGLGDAGLFMHRSAGRILARIESGVGDSLTHVHARGQQVQLRQGMHDAGGAEAGNREQQRMTASQLRIVQDEDLGGEGEAVDGTLLGGDAALDVAPDDGRQRLRERRGVSRFVSAAMTPVRASRRRATATSFKAEAEGGRQAWNSMRATNSRSTTESS